MLKTTPTLPSEKPGPGTLSVENCFELILESHKNRGVTCERRNYPRFDYSMPVFLTPLDEAGEPQLDETIGVIGRQISEKGFDFYNKDPIAAKFVIASFEFSPNRWLSLKMNLKWCRFGRHGYFENGGEFLEVVDSFLGVGLID